ncbi:hypothetical protein FRB95_003609 [Tulasnella sp. JGI-2019a]|nr:hypothetical protein FRB95_003609 [Tulasnella sp. JGI-2019a]
MFGGRDLSTAIQFDSQPPPFDSESSVIDSIAGSEAVHEAEACQSLWSKLRLHNSHLPIAELPDELLIKILYLSLCEFGKEYFIRLLELSQVSTLWYDLVKHSPILWGYAHSEHTTEEVEMALRRSKDALIDVVYIHRDDGSYLEAVLEERSRWRSITYVTYSERLFAHLNQGGFECLEDADIVNFSILGPIRLDNLFGQQPPKLRHLKLFNILVTWDSDIFSHLDTLDLTVDEFGGGPSTEQVITMLHASPGLTSLRLRCYESRPGAPYSPTIINLPRLHTLALDLPVWKAGQLFACLDIPLCRRFDFLFARNASEIFYTGGDNILSSMLRSATEIYLDISQWKAKFKWRTTRGDDGSWPFESTIDWPLITRAIHERLLDLFPSYTLPVVHLVIDPDRPRPIRQIIPLLSALPSVTSFVLKSTHPRDLIFDLSAPQPSSGAWLLPCLQSLEILVAHTDRDILLGMVQARHRDGVDLAKPAKGDKAPPSRLKSVAVMGSGWEDMDLRYLRESVAGVDWSIVS